MRRQERELRAEQDRAFREAARVDKEKMEKRQQLERLKKEQELEAERLFEERKRRSYHREQWRRSKRESMPEEPSAGTPGTIRVGVRLPNGGRIVRIFKASDSLETLYTFVDIQLPSSATGTEALSSPLPPEYSHIFDFKLVVSYPRRELPLRQVTLGEMDALKGGANLVVEMNASPDADDSSDAGSDS